MNIRRRYILLSRLQKLFLLFCAVCFGWGLFGIISSFYFENTSPVPTQGGVFREGIVGDPYSLILNPVFIYGLKDRGADADIVSLLFSGLMKFDSSSGKMMDHLASHVLSPDKRTYTFRLKDGLKWHDGAPITAEDIIFTYQGVIQNPAFSNDILKTSFKDVKITKLSEMEVSFEIPYPYKFFLTNFTVGLLPKHILGQVPVEQMEFHEFSQKPIGNGPFQFDHVEEVKKNVYTMFLKSFRNSSAFDPKFDSIEFVLYSSKNALFLDTNHLSAIRPFITESINPAYNTEGFTKKTFSLPQYSALFFNLKNPIFTGNSGQNLRMGLLAATNKDALLSFVPGVRIDTPLLESRKDDPWFSFSLEKAGGLLQSAGYFFPGAKPKTFLPEKSESIIISKPSSAAEFEFAKTAGMNSLFVGGEYPLKVSKTKVFVDNVQFLEKQKGAMDRQFQFEIPFAQTLPVGTHEIRLIFIGFDGSVVAEDAISLYIYDPSGQEKEEERKYAIREDKTGKPLSLKIVTTETPEYYKKVAEFLKEDWSKVGVQAEIKVLPISDFLGTVAQRDYDILLYGQNLGYNLDIFEFFHESQVGKGNLSEYVNPKASILIQEMRSTHVDEIREQKMQELREILKNDIPAIFLFSPTYTYFFDANIEGMDNKFIAVLKDRFSNMNAVFVQKERRFSEGKTWGSFPQWFGQRFLSFITFSL